MRELAAVISSSPAIMRSSVDLPQPEGPTKTTSSRSAIDERHVAHRLDLAEALADVLEVDRRHAAYPFALTAHISISTR